MATKKPGTAVAKWDEELAKQAAIAAGMEDSTASGQFFSLKGGVLQWNEAPLQGNQMGVIILDSILENVFYEGKYDPEVPQAPICFAFGRVESELQPHKLVVEAHNQQHDFCSGCEMNEWGSAEVGRGKACRNTRRLAMIPAGTFTEAGKFQLITDPEHFESAAVGYMKLPVTSVKGYASFVKQVAGALQRPPFGIATKVRVVPDPKSQFKVVFEPIVNLPDELMTIIMKRHTDAMAAIDFPYTPFEEEEKPAPKSRTAQKPGKSANRGRADRKY